MTGTAPIELRGAPRFLPLICYEIIFPGAVVPAGERPGWLLNVTNDAWFGISSGPYQHFQQARVRAIEEGLPLVRAANNGISAVVDPLGRIVQELPLGTEGVLDSRAAASDRRHNLRTVRRQPDRWLMLAAFLLIVLRYRSNQRRRASLRSDDPRYLAEIAGFSMNSAVWRQDCAKCARSRKICGRLRGHKSAKLVARCKISFRARKICALRLS